MSRLYQCERPRVPVSAAPLLWQERASAPTISRFKTRDDGMDGCVCQVSMSRLAWTVKGASCLRLVPALSSPRASLATLLMQQKSGPPCGRDPFRVSLRFHHPPWAVAELDSPEVEEQLMGSSLEHAEACAERGPALAIALALSAPG